MTKVWPNCPGSRDRGGRERIRGRQRPRRQVRRGGSRGHRR